MARRNQMLLGISMTPMHYMIIATIGLRTLVILFLLPRINCGSDWTLHATIRDFAIHVKGAIWRKIT